MTQPGFEETVRRIPLCRDDSNIKTREMTMRLCYSTDDDTAFQIIAPNLIRNDSFIDHKEEEEVVNRTLICPSCGHHLQSQHQVKGGIRNWPGLPAGVKFDPTDEQILEHLEAKVKSDSNKLHPLIDEFIPTLEGENGICYTHPENLPGVSKDGQIRHFFHRPPKAYTTGKRKRRKVHTDEEDGNETRWHKTGKTRPVFGGEVVKGFKKILVLYINYGRRKKPEKTNWVMHQYHLGVTEDEKDGELVASKVFFQKQPRQCGNSNQNMVKELGSRTLNNTGNESYGCDIPKNAVGIIDYYNPTTFISYCHRRESSSHKLGDEGHDGSSFIRIDTGTSE